MYNWNPFGENWVVCKLFTGCASGFGTDSGDSVRVTIYHARNESASKLPPDNEVTAVTNP
jgi:hypothetical protein